MLVCTYVSEAWTVCKLADMTSRLQKLDLRGYTLLEYKRNLDIRKVLNSQTENSGKNYYILSFDGHWPHRKRLLQQIIVVAGTCLPSCYLVTIGGNTKGPTDTRVKQFFYCCVHSLPLERVYGAVA
jgi:hypothetical protein